VQTSRPSRSVALMPSQVGIDPAPDLDDAARRLTRRM
jgi:hypothetical protein